MALAALAAAGCAMSHERQTDAGDPGGDTAVTTGCLPGEPPPPGAYCYFVGADHVCGDAGLSLQCFDGAWVCPVGTSPESACWCFGLVLHGPGCICSPSGWMCPDPADAGPPEPACPPDPSTVIGMPCAVEGASCGSCPSPCSGFCNLATCTGGVWQTLELGCADPLFACGPSAFCSRWTEYCRHTLSDVGGVPDDYRCAPLPEDCPADCTCFGGSAGGCTTDPDGGVTVTGGGA